MLAMQTGLDSKDFYSFVDLAPKSDSNWSEQYRKHCETIFLLCFSSHFRLEGATTYPFTFGPIEATPKKNKSNPLMTTTILLPPWH